MSEPAGVDPAPLAERAIKDVARIADRIRLLSQEAVFAARSRNPADLSAAAEQLLPLHVEFARLYRTWLAAHQQPSVPVQPGPVDGMSV